MRQRGPLGPSNDESSKQSQRGMRMPLDWERLCLIFFWVAAAVVMTYALSQQMPRLHTGKESGLQKPRIKVPQFGLSTGNYSFAKSTCPQCANRSVSLCAGRASMCAEYGAVY